MWYATGMGRQMKSKISALLAGVFAISVVAGHSANGSGYEIIKLTSENGTQSPAAFFAGASDKAVVFVPGAVFDKESWYFLAERLQARHIASFALDGKTPDAVRAAVDCLKAKGFKRISLVGGSMGGAAVLNALERQADESITGIILLAPSGGAPVDSDQIDKLFIIAKEDSPALHASVKAVYAHSAEPKTFEEIEGSAHAQHLFKTSQKELLSNLIVDFIADGE